MTDVPWDCAGVPWLYPSPCCALKRGQGVVSESNTQDRDLGLGDGTDGPHLMAGNGGV